MLCMHLILDYNVFEIWKRNAVNLAENLIYFFHFINQKSKPKLKIFQNPQFVVYLPLVIHYVLPNDIHRCKKTSIRIFCMI